MSDSVGTMSNLSETFTRRITDRLTIETTVYEDGYIFSALMDDLGFELDSIDGHERTRSTRESLEDYLYDLYVN